MEDTVSLNETVDLRLVIWLSGCDELERIDKIQNGKQIEFNVYKNHPSGENICHVERGEATLIEELTFTETGLFTLVFNDGELVKEVYVEE